MKSGIANGLHEIWQEGGGERVGTAEVGDCLQRAGGNFQIAAGLDAGGRLVPGEGRDAVDIHIHVVLIVTFAQKRLQVQLVSLRSWLFDGQIHRHIRPGRVMEQKGFTRQTSVFEQVELGTGTRCFGTQARFINTAVGGAGISGEDGKRMDVGSLIAKFYFRRGGRSITCGEGTGRWIAVNPVVENRFEGGVILVVELELGIGCGRGTGAVLDIGGHHKRGIRSYIGGCRPPVRLPARLLQLEIYIKPGSGLGGVGCPVAQIKSGPHWISTTRDIVAARGDTIGFEPEARNDAGLRFDGFGELEVVIPIKRVSIVTLVIYPSSVRAKPGAANQGLPRTHDNRTRDGGTRTKLLGVFPIGDIDDVFFAAVSCHDVERFKGARLNALGYKISGAAFI